MKVTENKDIIQSYLLTVARYDTNIYAKRILTHIVAANQDYIEGQKVSGGVVINIEEDLFRNREYTLDLKNMLQGDNDKNYQRVKEAFHSLQGTFIRFDDVDNNHISVPFITALLIKPRSGVARFRMSELIYKAFTDFTKGYRRYEFELMLSFKSGYTMRFYELMSEKNTPITYTIEYLKELFKLENNYERANDFIRYVIEPAQNELNEKSPYTFNFTVNKQGRRFHSITFEPVYQPKLRNQELEGRDAKRDVNISWIADRQTRRYLMEYYQFSNRELHNNFDLLELASKKINLLELLVKIAPKANRVEEGKRKGFVIGCIKTELKNQSKKTAHKKQTPNEQPSAENLINSLADTLTVK